MRRIVPALALLLLAARPAAAQDDPLAKLESTRLGLQFNDVSIDYVLEFLSTQAGVPILLDPELRRNRTDEELEVSIQLVDVSGRAALEATLLLTQLGFEVEGPVVIVRDRESVRGRQIVKIHDVGDLVGVGDVHEGKSDHDSSWDDDVEALSIDVFQQLIEESVAPGTWDPPNSIVVRGRRIMVRHTPEVQAQVRRLLDGLREGASRQVEVEVSLYRLDAAGLAALREEGAFPSADLPQRLDARIGTREGTTEALLSRAVAVSTAGQPVVLGHRLREPHVSGQDPIAAAGAGIAAPEVETRSERLDLTVQPISTAEDRTVWLRIDLESDLPLADRVAETPRGAVALPSTRRHRIQTVARVPADRCLALEAGASSVVVVRPFVRRLQGIEPPPFEPTEAEKRRAEFVARLEAKAIEARFRGQPMAEVLDKIRRVGGFNIVVARELLHPEFLRAPFTLETASITVWQLFRLIETIHDVEVQLLDGIVVLRERGGAPSRSVFRTYDVQQIVSVGEEAWSHLELGLDRPEPRRERWTGTVFGDDSAQFVVAEELEELVRSTIDPAIWDRGDSSLHLLRGRLIVSAPPETHERVAAFLAGIRSAAEGGVRFRITRFRARPGLLADLGVAAGSRLVLAGEVAERMRARLDPARDEVEVYGVTGTIHRWLGIGRADAVAYPAAVRTAVAQDSAILGLQTGTYRTGASLRISGIAHAGGAFLVSLDALTARLDGEPARYAAGDLAIEGPRVAKARAVLSIAVEPGQALLVPVGAEHLLVEVERVD